MNRNVSELSKALLEGCKLLGDSCPETNVPLVSTKDGRMYSVGNGCYYARNGSELHKLGPADECLSAVPTSPGMAVLPPLPASPWGGSSALPTAPASGAMDGRLSQAVAQKLLEGYTLLSESCEATNVPLVQDQHGRILSVGTGKTYERYGGELRECAPGSALASPAPGGGLGAMPPAASAPPLISTSPYAPPPPASTGFAIA